MIGALALAWGVIVAVPVRALARRRTTATRARGLRPRRRAVRRTRRRLTVPRALITVGKVLATPRRMRRRRRLDDELAGQIAVAVDLVGVGVAAGCTPYLAVDLAARWSPPLVARELEGVVRACAIGESFDAALRDLGIRRPPLRGLTESLRTSARLGSPAAPALMRLASEVRADLRRRAEVRARTVPVRLAFPLVGCILPAFALLTVVPVVIGGLHR